MAEKSCEHCGTTEDLTGVYYLGERCLCENCKNKYEIMRGKHRMETSKFLRAAKKLATKDPEEHEGGMWDATQDRS